MIESATAGIGAWLDQTFFTMDYAVFEFFSKLQQEWLTPIVSAFTRLGDSEFVIPLLLLGLILCFSKKTRKVGATLFLAIIIGTLITNVIAKPLIDRPRPYVTLGLDEMFMSWYQRAGAHIESDKSFPSGHTTAAFEVGLALFMTIKNKKIKWIFPVYSVLIAASRLYLMVHYSTDVIGGMLVGTIAAVSAYFIVKAIMSMLAKTENKLLKKVNDIDLFFKEKKDA